MREYVSRIKHTIHSSHKRRAAIINPVYTVPSALALEQAELQDSPQSSPITSLWSYSFIPVTILPYTAFAIDVINDVISQLLLREKLSGPDLPNKPFKSSFLQLITLVEDTFLKQKRI
jgi:hypothetical protein